MTLPNMTYLVLGNPSNTVPFTVPTKIVLPRFHLSSGFMRASEVGLKTVFKEPIKGLFLYATEQEQNNWNTIKLCWKHKKHLCTQDGTLFLHVLVRSQENICLANG